MYFLAFPRSSLSWTHCVWLKEEWWFFLSLILMLLPCSQVSWWNCLISTLTVLMTPAFQWFLQFQCARQMVEYYLWLLSLKTVYRNRWYCESTSQGVHIWWPWYETQQLTIFTYSTFNTIHVMTKEISICRPSTDLPSKKKKGNNLMIKNPLLDPTRINLPTAFPVFSPTFPLSSHHLLCNHMRYAGVFPFQSIMSFYKPVTLHKIHGTFQTGWIWLSDAWLLNDLKDENGTSFLCV